MKILFGSVLAAMIVALTTGCSALPIKGGFCDVVTPEARCAVEKAAEDQINGWLDKTNEKGRVDLNYVCPDHLTCPAPVVAHGAEAGDFKVQKLEVPIASNAPAPSPEEVARTLAESKDPPQVADSP